MVKGDKMAEKVVNDLILGTESFFNLADVLFRDLFDTTGYVW